MDLGAEYHGYTADVTRTIPANGKFLQYVVLSQRAVAERAGRIQGETSNGALTCIQWIVPDSLAERHRIH